MAKRELGKLLDYHYTPSGDYVFAADTDTSPSDFEKFDISGTGITAIGDSPYHGDYSISGKVWVTPDGQYVISRGGHVFLASDMTYVQSISNLNSSIVDVTFDENNSMFMLTGTSLIKINLDNFDATEEVTSQEANFIEYANNSVFGLSSDGAKTSLIFYTIN